MSLLPAILIPFMPCVASFDVDGQQSARRRSFNGSLTPSDSELWIPFSVSFL